MSTAIPHNPALSDAAGHLLDHAGHVAGNLRCPHCGYNLRSLARGGKCPECGTTVAAGLNAHHIFHYDRVWLAEFCQGVRTLARGLALLLLTPITFIIQWTFGFPPTHDSTLDFTLNLLPFPATLFAAGVVYAGSRRLTGLEPDPAPGRDYTSWQRALSRHTTVSAGVTWLTGAFAVGLVFLVSAGDWHAPFAMNIRAWMPWLVAFVIVMVLGFQSVTLGELIRLVADDLPKRAFVGRWRSHQQASWLILGLIFAGGIALLTAAVQSSFPAWLPPPPAWLDELGISLVIAFTGILFMSLISAAEYLYRFEHALRKAVHLYIPR